MRKLNHGFWFALMCLSLLAAAQEGTSNLDDIFDDGTRENKIGIVKLDLLNIIHGELGFRYEYKLTNVISIEAGLGALLPYYVIEIPELAIDLDDTAKISSAEVKGGFSFMVEPRFKLAFTGSAYDSYIAPVYRQRIYSLIDGHTANYRDVMLALGVNFSPPAPIVFDLYLGGGYRNKKFSESARQYFVEVTSTRSAPLFFIGLKVGYIL